MRVREGFIYFAFIRELKEPILDLLGSLVVVGLEPIRKIHFSPFHPRLSLHTISDHRLEVGAGQFPSVESQVQFDICLILNRTCCINITAIKLIKHTKLFL